MASLLLQFGYRDVILDRMRNISVTPTGVLAVIGAIYIARSTWRARPDWMKRRGDDEDLPEKDANDDLASVTTIISKLRQMRKLVSQRTDEVTPDDLPWYKVHASFFSMIHLSEELRRVDPGHRDRSYEGEKKKEKGPGEGKEEVSDEEWKELRKLLDYADWAYLDSYNELLGKLQKNKYQLLRHDKTTEPGRVGHYISLNHDTKTCLIGLKGTSTFSDVLTDAVGLPCPHTLESSPFDVEGPTQPGTATGTNDITCHEGIWVAAQMVADDVQDFITRLVLPCGYSILIVGHSLGAGTACLLGLLLRSRIPELRKDDVKNAKLKVVAFATPAVLNRDAAVACAPFTTSVVNNSDIVPRMSVSNLIVMNKLMLTVEQKLEERGLSPSSIRKFFKHLKDLSKLDEDTLMSTDEIDAFFDEAHADEKLGNFLAVPGRVVMMFERGIGKVARKEQGAEPEVGCIVTDGGSKMLRQIETMTTMITDHFCSSYIDNMEDLMREKGLLE